MCAQSEHAIDIARENINLDIRLLSRFDRSECGVLGGMRDDVDRRMRASVLRLANFVDRQRHAVERDRTLGRDHRRELSRDGESDASRIAVSAGTDYLGHSIDVTGHNMPA